jgi:predicted anti-sigma-YlaC factor YlaD
MNTNDSRRTRLGSPRWIAVGSLALLLFASGCSIKRMAVNAAGNALAGGGTVFAADDDPELIRAAAPFSLKLMESLLAESPNHRKLLEATASGFTQYAYAFVQQEADEMEEIDFEAARSMRLRATRLYLRARDYGLRGLETHYPGFEQALRRDPHTAVRRTRTRDVELVYWTGIAWAAAISAGKDDVYLIAELPQVEALMERALELREDFDQGAIHTFFIQYEMSRSKPLEQRTSQARRHFQRAVELSGGLDAGPYVSLAEGMAVDLQDAGEFNLLLRQALAIDPKIKPELRLSNLILQRRARWLLSRSEDLFLAPPPGMTEERNHENHENHEG